MSFEYVSPHALTAEELAVVAERFRRNGFSVIPRSSGFSLGGEREWTTAELDVSTSGTVVAIHAGSRQERQALITVVEDAMRELGVEIELVEE